ncbi:MAG: formate/nitrite transporter family protein [Nitrospirota bacterium]
MGYKTGYEVMEKLIEFSITKTVLPFPKMILLGLLAGVYIALGGILMTVVVSDISFYSGFGITRLISGSVFSLGLILVILVGAELFTGNNLMVIGLLSRRIGFIAMLKNWLISYSTNFAGSLMLVSLIGLSQLWFLNDMEVGFTMVDIANSKVNLGFWTAFWRGVGCNFLVCLAVWLSVSGEDNISRILGIYFPITAFVALGFEHSVANMFLIPMGILAASQSDVAPVISHLDLSHLNVTDFLVYNLIPVTLGNTVGGAFLVGYIYWYIYGRR